MCHYSFWTLQKSSVSCWGFCSVKPGPYKLDERCPFHPYFTFFSAVVFFLQNFCFGRVHFESVSEHPAVDLNQTLFQFLDSAIFCWSASHFNRLIHWLLICRTGACHTVVCFRRWCTALDMRSLVGVGTEKGLFFFEEVDLPICVSKVCRRWLIESFDRSSAVGAPTACQSPSSCRYF